MIDRYSLPEMSSIWTDEAKFDMMLIIEKLVARYQGELGIIPKDAADHIQDMKINISRLREIEYIVKHETNAFIDSACESIDKKYAKWFHFGLTSSDILDSSLSVIINVSFLILEKEIELLLTSLYGIYNKYKDVLCIGRTHGMHAETITFGSKISKFLAEIIRNKIRLNNLISNIKLIKLSGITGNYTTISIEIERKVAEFFNMESCSCATQVIPRDYFAELITTLALYTTGLERIALEIRHLSRPEIDEISEGFSEGQKGSSAMPHKKNPIDSENITGLSRLMRSYIQPAMEDILLWHERDMSHSSVERVIIPDAFILAHYMTVKMTNILTNLVIKPENMQKNIELTKTLTSSSKELLDLISNGMTRKEAYTFIQNKNND